MARAILPALGATFLLSGCVTAGMSGPAALGAGQHRSIKDDPEPAMATPAPKQTPPAKTAIAPAPQRPYTPQGAAPPKRSDLPACISGSECMVRLKAMIADPSRSWIGKPQPPAEYANGTRLFAYRALRSQLTCQQLNSALKETAGAGAAFRTAVPGVSAVQAQRVLALNTEIESELQAELAARCKS